MNNKFIAIVLILFSIFILSLNGINFSALFIVNSIWIVYFAFELRKISKKMSNKWIKLFIKVYNILVIVFISSFLLVESILIFKINNFKSIENIESLDYVIVLGAGLDGENVGKVLKSRLDKAIEYYNIHKDVNIIVSGGLGEGEIISEADAMYKYLIEQGVNPNQIIKENKATTTLENIKYSKEILIKRNDKNKKVLIVTNEFHLYRAMVISNILGVKNEGLASITPIKIRVNYLIREYPTLIIDIIRTNCQLS